MAEVSVGRPLCVVLDTNQWDAHPMLRSRLAASLIFLVERHRGKIGVPDVVAREVESHVVELCTKAVKEIRSNLDRLRTIVGASPNPALPDEVTARGALSRRFEELGDLLVRVDATDHHFRAAGEMVLVGRRPNAPGKQQFKDSLLWQSVLELAAVYSVLLVTADTAFFADAKDGNELHPELATEAMEHVQGVRSVQEAVSLLQVDAPELDLEPILNAIDASLRPQVDEAAAQFGFATEAVNNVGSETFVTGKPGEALVVFEVTHDLLGPDDGLARAITTGEAIVTQGEVTSLEARTIEVEIYGESGFTPATTVHFVRALGRGRSGTHGSWTPSPRPPMPGFRWSSTPSNNECVPLLHPLTAAGRPSRAIWPS